MKENIKFLQSLLDKKNLTEEDRLEIKKVVQNDPEAKEFYGHYLKLRDAVISSSHLTVDDLGEYVLVKGNNPSGILTGDKFNRIEEHLKSCKKCGEIFLQLTGEYSDIGNFLDGNYGVPAENAGTEIRRKGPAVNKFFRYSFTSAIGAAAVYLLLLITSAFITPGTTKLAKIEDNAVNYVTRGRGTDEFQKGLMSLDNSEFRQAAAYFESDIENDKDKETIFYTHYILGLTYLEISRHNFIGMFTSYDASGVNSAVKNFRTCIAENTSGNYPDITANSYFYLGKAELMLGNKSAAIEYFDKVIELQGGKTGIAKALIKDLE